mgnify:CR=1 FL=1
MPEPSDWDRILNVVGSSRRQPRRKDPAWDALLAEHARYQAVLAIIFEHPEHARDLARRALLPAEAGQ